MKKLMFGLLMFISLNLTAQAVTLFFDDFESPTSTSTTWFSPDDNDPTTPVIGQNWTVVEVNPWEMQEASYSQNLAAASFGPSATGGAQYLHMIRTNTHAWASLSAADQAVVAANGNLRLSVEVFGLSGHDGWGSDLRIVGYDSAATVGTNPAFDVWLVDGGYFLGGGGYGLNGPVNYVNSLGTNTTALVNKVNMWQYLDIDADFGTDTFSLTLDGITVPGLTWAGGDLSKIQSVVLTLGNTGSRGFDVRGGYDNLELSSVPEPSVVALLGLSGLVLWRRKRTAE